MVIALYGGDSLCPFSAGRMYIFSDTCRMGDFPGTKGYTNPPHCRKAGGCPGNTFWYRNTPNVSTSVNFVT